MNCRFAFLSPLGLISALAVATLLGACGGSSEKSPQASSGAATSTGGLATATKAPEVTQTPIAAASSTPAGGISATATPEPGGGVVYNGYQLFGDFSYADPIDFPENVLMVVATSCDGCDGVDALYRVWRNSGETHVDRLVDASISGVEGASITSFAVRDSLHDIVVAICKGCGGQVQAGSSVSLYRTIDGGITWRSILTTAPGEAVTVEAITNDGLALGDPDGRLSYFRGEPIDPPAGAGRLMPDSSRAGTLLWLSEAGNTVLNKDGEPVAIVEPGSLVESLAFNDGSHAIAAVGWAIGFIQGPFKGFTVTATGPDGTLSGFRADTRVAPAAVLDDGSVLGQLSDAGDDQGSVIGLIDVLRGVLTPIHGALIDPPFGNSDRATGDVTLQGAVSGPFLLVKTGQNCLPVRTTTDPQSEELTCASDGTLVYDLQNTTTVGALHWDRIRLLDGREGYALSEYLVGD